MSKSAVSVKIEITNTSVNRSKGKKIFSLDFTKSIPHPENRDLTISESFKIWKNISLRRELQHKNKCIQSKTEGVKMGRH